MTTREENKKKLIQKVIARKPLCRVLRTINWFGWATESQIAQYQELGRRRINVLLRELYKNGMVRYKRVVHFPSQRYWYLISKGREAIRKEIEDKLIQKVISQEEYNFLKPVPRFKKARIPHKPDSHAYHIRETIIILKKNGFVSLSPRVSLWPKKLKRYDHQYKTRPDNYCNEKIDEWAQPIAVEVENSFRGNIHFPKKLAKQQKMFFETGIPFLYRPTNKEVETAFINILNRIHNTGEYVIKVKGRSRGYGEYDYKIGIRNALGFLFSNVDMTRFYAVPTRKGEGWREYFFEELPLRVRDMVTAARHGDFLGPLGVSRT